MTSGTQLSNTEKRESSNNRKVYCYYCRKEGHYSSQCLVKTNEKQPAVNMVTAEVTDGQHVTMRSVKDVVRKQVEDRNKKEGKRRFNGSLELRTVLGRDREREREREREQTQKLNFKKL